MRRSPASVTLLLAGLLLPAVAAAQQRPGWVDPPKKEPAQETRSDAPKPKAAAPEAASRNHQASRPAERERPRTTRAAPAETSTSRSAEATGRDGRSPRSLEARRHRTPQSRNARRMAGRRGERHMAAPVVPPAPAPMASGYAEWGDAAQRFAADYLNSVSSPGLAAAAPHFYAPQVRFHGRILTLSAVMAEKRRFARRWPERHYEPVGEATRVACDGASATCAVRMTYTFEAVNPERGARSQGLAELVLTVGFAGDRPMIVGESSRVIRRGAMSADTRRSRGA